ncbi:hypothetical protein QF030_006135 [Streptomyces rishiriensis]|uniref:Uncharacterized protein n=1 Tax=Streptomyces rishiriensis TaxID=68264 RepID=A0ABU0NXS6_STRRH|nr:hypothetical protein [Streptomyces rishiriensis]
MKRKRLDLSVPQVAGSAVAAVVAAKLASYFGVYGTILGAGLVSVVATCGGSLFQHFFRRTGEQLREVQVREPQVREPRVRDTWVAAEPRVRTPPAPGEFTEGTVHRARSGRRKRPVAAAALVFGVAMAGITTYELVSGDSFSGDRGTTVTEAVTGGGSSSGSSPGPSGAESDSTSAPASSSSPSSPSAGGSAASGGVSPSASGSGEDAEEDPGGTTAGTAPTPTATVGSSGTDDPAVPVPTESATTPAPSASSRSGTGDQGPADPAAP